MGGDVLYFLELSDHVELREDGQCFKPPTVSLKNSIKSGTLVQDDSQHNCYEIEIIVLEGIGFGIIALWIMGRGTNL